MHPAEIELLNAALGRSAGLVAEQLGALTATLERINAQAAEIAGADYGRVEAAVESELTRIRYVVSYLYVALLRDALPHLMREDLTDAQRDGCKLAARRAWELAKILHDAQPSGIMPEFWQPDQGGERGREFFGRGDDVKAEGGQP